MVPGTVNGRAGRTGEKFLANVGATNAFIDLYVWGSVAQW